MKPFTVHTLETAPAKSRASLEALKASIGMIPNMAATMAESPALLDVFVAMRNRFGQADFTPLEQEMILLAAAVENGCTYCAAVHSTLALHHGAPKEAVVDVRDGGVPAEPRLKVLASTTRALTRGRGAITAADVAQAERAGLTRSMVLDICLGIAVGSLVSLIDHLVPETPLDAAFEAQAWSPPD